MFVINSIKFILIKWNNTGNSKQEKIGRNGHVEVGNEEKKRVGKAS